MFAKTTGFRHHRVATEHARANREVESFMKMITRQNRLPKYKAKMAVELCTRNAIRLSGYLSTPHPATGVKPYVLNRQIRPKLVHQTGNEMKKLVIQPCVRRISDAKKRSLIELQEQEH